MPASGDVTVTILPQFKSVFSVRGEPWVITWPEGCVSWTLPPLVLTENVNVMRCVTESTGTLKICALPSNGPVAHNTVDMFSLVDSLTSWKDLPTSDRWRNMESCDPVQ